MKKLTSVVLAALGGKEAIRLALEEAILEALQEALQEEPKAKAPRRKAQAEALEAKAQALQAQAEPKPKRTRARAQAQAQADGTAVRSLVKALADLGAAVGPREAELLERRGETLARRAKPGQAPRVLAGVLEHLRGLTLPEVAKAARLGYYDLATVAGVGSLVEPPKA